MKLTDYSSACRDYDRIEKAIMYIETNFDRQPELKEISDHIGLSEFHFQRLFSNWVGISPKRFLQFLTKEHVKDAAGELRPTCWMPTFDAGLSGPGRLHDLFVACEAVTPGEFKAQGRGLSISYGFHESPFGECLIAVTGRGICWLSFVRDGSRQTLLAELCAPGKTPASSRTLPRRVRWSRAFTIPPCGGARAPCRSWSRAPTSRSRSGRRCCASRSAPW